MTMCLITPEKWARFTPAQERAAVAWLARHGVDYRNVFKLECVGSRVYAHTYELDEQGRRHLCPAGCGCIAEREIEIDADGDPPPWIEAIQTIADR